MIDAVLDYLFGPMPADDPWGADRRCPDCGHDARDHFSGQLATSCGRLSGRPEPGSVRGTACGCERAIADPPALAAAAGHNVTVDTDGFRQVERWECACGAAVLRYKGGVHGTALTVRCVLAFQPGDRVATPDSGPGTVVSVDLHDGEGEPTLWVHLDGDPPDRLTGAMAWTTIHLTQTANDPAVAAD